MILFYIMPAPLKKSGSTGSSDLWHLTSGNLQQLSNGNGYEQGKGSIEQKKSAKYSDHWSNEYFLTKI